MYCYSVLMVCSVLPSCRYMRWSFFCFVFRQSYSHGPTPNCHSTSYTAKTPFGFTGSINSITGAHDIAPASATSKGTHKKNNTEKEKKIPNDKQANEHMNERTNERIYTFTFEVIAGKKRRRQPLLITHTNRKSQDASRAWLTASRDAAHSLPGLQEVCRARTNGGRRHLFPE